MTDNMDTLSLMSAAQGASVEETIRKNLIRFREEAGLSLREASNAVDISLDYLSKIERGARTVPGAVLLQKLAELYGHKVDHFYLHTPPPRDPSLMPAFALMVLDRNIDGDLLDRARHCLDELNLERRRRLDSKARREAALPPVPKTPPRPARPKPRGSSDNS